ncbi:MAG: Abi family protein [Rhodopseudomonas sp.]|uniref:hypothetical protein n=1 Tax=Rhodopseudomonas sp. TaxID=1078 RepID=UPI0039E39117
MQLINSPDAASFPAVEKAIQSERLQRYMPAAKNDKALAFKYYLWNCKISEAFYLPLHFCEILCRNAIHNQLLYRLGNEWHNHSSFKNLLDPSYRRELEEAVTDEHSQHGDDMTPHHVVSALHFGFWEHVTTKRFQRLVWHYGIHDNFPGAHFSKKREDLRGLIESARRWRNRIAHHNAVFDKAPTRKYQDAMDLIRWSCPTTHKWVLSVSEVQEAINSRPVDPNDSQIEE